MNPNYRGRFAPTPSGPLHFGSLLAAVASYLDARSSGGKWLVRIEDTDGPRCPPGMADNILDTLEAYGFEWDEEVLFQSARSEIYSEFLKKLERQSLVFECGCSRKDIAAISGAESKQGPYPGTCRAGRGQKELRAKRFLTSQIEVSFDDGLHGTCFQNLEKDVGDFVLWRTDGCFAYHLAVVVDDALQGITHIVRGSDLLDSTPRQIALARSLEFSIPKYFHIPIAVNEQGEKLSKQTLASALVYEEASLQWWNALHFLKQSPPQQLKESPLPQVIDWGIKNWDILALKL